MTAKYVYGAGIDEPIQGLSPQGTVPVWYYHYDGLGSVTAITDSTGTVSESYSYDAFGKPSAVSTVGNRYMFTGREYDAETGLYYYRARYYSPTIGRFLQTDQWPTPLTDPSSLVNRYLYVNNNPINWIDPYGWDKTKKDMPWWEKLEKGYYYGTGYGEEALDWYARMQIETGNPLWTIPGLFSALWTPETYQATAGTLITAGSLSGWAATTGMNLGLHPAHHTFSIFGKDMALKHIQITLWEIGKKSSHKIFRMPLPFK